MEVGLALMIPGLFYLFNVGLGSTGLSAVEFLPVGNDWFMCTPVCDKLYLAVMICPLL